MRFAGALYACKNSSHGDLVVGFGLLVVGLHIIIKHQTRQPFFQISVFKIYYLQNKLKKRQSGAVFLIL